MKIKRHKFKCSVPGCKNTDSIVMGKGTYFDVGCLHLCRDCAQAYANAWRDALSAESSADTARVKTVENGEKHAKTEKNGENSEKTTVKRVKKTKNAENGGKTAHNTENTSADGVAAVTV